MPLEITPPWDRDQTVTVALCAQRRELVVRAPGQASQYVLDDRAPDRAGWRMRHLATGQPTTRRAVATSEVVAACLRDLDTEEAVLDLTRQAAERAARRAGLDLDSIDGRAARRAGPWAKAARCLASEARQAARRNRISTLPFQVVFAQRSDPGRNPQPLSATQAAERLGWHWANGIPDTTRVLRRLGLADSDDKKGGRTRQRAVTYDVALALCRALDLEPVEVGL